MNKVRWIPLLAFTVFFSPAAWPQADAQRTTITLRMDWKREDSHYGKDFIELHRPCEGKSCVCVAAFKVISSKSNAKEFADYVTSFEHWKVPIVYDVVLSEEGGVVGARFLRLGNWIQATGFTIMTACSAYRTHSKLGATQVEPCPAVSTALLIASLLSADRSWYAQ